MRRFRIPISTAPKDPPPLNDNWFNAVAKDTDAERIPKKRKYMVIIYDTTIYFYENLLIFIAKFEDSLEGLPSPRFKNLVSRMKHLGEHELGFIHYGQFQEK